MEQKTKQTYEKAVNEYKELSNKEDDAKWRKGDLALEVEVEYGQRRLQGFSKEVGEDYSILRVYRRVAGIFRNGERSPNLSWSHHLIACHTDEPKEWIDKAKENKWSVRQLKSAIQKEKDPIENSGREVTSLSLNKKIFEDFKNYCKERGLTISYVVEDFMKQVLTKSEMGVVNEVTVSLRK